MYELLYIIPANFTEEEIVPIKDKIKKFIKDIEGNISHEKNLGLQKLAYPIRQVHRGYYILLHFDLDKEKLSKLNRDLLLTAEVLRHQIVKIPKGEWKVKKRKERPSPPAGRKEIRIERKTIAKPEEEKKEEKGEEKGEEKEKEKPKAKVDLKELEDKIDKILKI